MKSVNTRIGRHASLVGITLALMFMGAALRAQQAEPEHPVTHASQFVPQEQATPPQQTPPQEQAPTTKSNTEQPAPQGPEAQPQQHSPLDDLDDLEPPAKASHAPQAPTEVESLHALVGRPLVVSSPARIQRISVADPDVIDTVLLNQNQILINAKALGRVSLVVWDSSGRSQEFDISVDRDAPNLPDQLVKALADPPLQAKEQNQKTAWVGWAVFGSIILAAGAIFGARRQRAPRLDKLDIEARESDSPGDSREVEVAVAPPQQCTEADLKKGAMPDTLKSTEPASPAPETGNAERNQRLLETYLEAAVKGMFLTLPGAGAGASPFSPAPSGLRPPKDSETQAGGGSQTTSETGTGGSPTAASTRVQSPPLLETITALAFAVEAKGPYRTGHSQAVSRLAARIAIQAGLSAAEVEETRLAGLVHDIGNIHVPQSVCNKPGRLTAEEFEMMSSHSACGAKILEPLNVKIVERIVRHHHERYDGRGYPDGLAGETIPMGARIVAVAECFHNMVCDLPYKSARTFEDALAELRRCSGMQFDPHVVTTFLDWIQIYSASPRQS
jgi:HD-GYP domain-containing protein (c-di-GMP phosphodiesterase class II)